MIPKERYLKLDPEEQKYWHSHEFEVTSGMLVLPYPESHKHQKDKWDELESQAMAEVVTLVCFSPPFLPASWWRSLLDVGIDPSILTSFTVRQAVSLLAG
jgi:hypothetical protein